MFFESLEARSLLATITAGAGPGGFEVLSGANSLQIWLDASKPFRLTPPPANGGNVSTWEDLSGFNRDATLQSGQPIYVTADAAANNKPAVRFDTAGGADTLATAFNFDALGANYTIFAVSRFNGPTNQRVITSITHNWLLGHHNPTTEGWYFEGGPYQQGAQDQNARIYTALVGPDADGVAGGIALTDFWSNGTRVNNDDNRNSPTDYKPGQLQFGGHIAYGQNSDANIAEFLIINRVINEAERMAILNALSSKYNLAIGAEDLYAGDTLANGDNDLNVFGIGRFNPANQLLSSGQAGFGIESTSIPDDGDFVGAGHNKPTNSFTTAGIPAGVVRRFDRSWYVQVQDLNDNLGATLAFDYSDAGLAIGTASTFKLLRSTDNGVSWVDVGASAIVSGDQIKFNLTSAQLSTALYTLGDAAGPVVTTSAGNQTYSISAAAVAIDPSITVVAGGNPTMTGATVSIVGFINGNADVLALPAPVGAITGSYNNTTGVLTLSGSDTPANYQLALRSVTFAKATYQGVPSRTINFQVNDAAALSGSNTRGIVINATAASTAVIWDGSGDGLNWTDNSNWVGDVAPDSNDVATFTTLDPGIVNVPTNVVVGSISFTSTGAYTLNSSGGNIALTIGAVTQSGTSNNSINAPLQIFAPSSAITLDVAAATTLTVNAAISGTGDLNKINGGIVILGGTNSYTGGTNVNGGTLRIAGTSVVPSAPAGAAGIYTFDSVAGSVVTNNGTLGAAENGNLIGGSTVVAGGQIGNAMNITGGATAHMEIGTSPGISLAGGVWTAAAWFNGIFPTTDWRTLFRGGGNDHQIIIESGTNNLGVYDNAGGGGFRDSGFDLPVSVTGWHHIAAVGSGSTTTLFIDGVQVGVSDRKSVTDIFSVGCYQGGGQRFSNLIDEVYIYQLALTPAQITQLYQNGAGIPVVTSANSIPDGSVVAVAAGASLDLNAIPEVVGALSGAGTVTSGVAGGVNFSVGGGNTSGTFSGVIQNGLGTVGLTKIGTGTQTLSGANTYTGATTVADGVLQIAGAADRLPTGTVLTTGSGSTGGVFDLNGQNQTVAGLISAGAGINRVVNSGAGTPNLTVNLTAGTNTFAGILGSAGQNSFNLVKNGAGTEVLTGANTFTGTTTINGGALSINADTALGAVPGAATANAITIANNAALRATATFTINANRGITLGAGGGSVDTPGVGLFWGGLFTGGTGLNKTGNGDFILTNAAAGTNPGTININAGRLFFTNQNALGTGIVNVASGGTLDYQTGGALTLANTVNLVSGANIASRNGALTIPNATLPTAGLLIINQDDQNTNTVILPQNIALSGTLTIQVGGGGGNGGVGRLDGVISGTAPILKTQTGVLHLNNSGNTFSGDLSVRAGAVRVSQNNALGTTAGATNVLSGARLEFTGAVNYTTAENVRLSGDGVGGTISNLSGDNLFAGNVQIVTGSVATSTSFTGGDVGEGLDFDGTFLYAVNVRGPGGLPIRNANFTDQATAAPGVVISAQNEILNWQTPNFGATTNDTNLAIVMQSIRWSANPATVDIALNNLTIGQAYKLQLLAYEPPYSRGWDVFFDGTQIFNNMTAGTAGTNIGTVLTYEFLAMSPTHTIVMNGDATSFGDKNPILDGLTLEQNASVVSGPGTANVNSDAGTLTMAGVVSGALSGIRKVGVGNVAFAGANTYGGQTTVLTGALAAASNAALGATTAGTTVLPGGTLAFANNVTVTGESIIASGTGAAGAPGAIINFSGTNTLASNVTGTGAELRIGSLAGTLTVSGNVNMTTAALSFDGPGNVTVSGVISQGAALPLNGVMSDLEIWLDASDPNADGSTVANGALVSNWQDKSGKDRDFNSVLGDPNYVTASSNGRPAINFDGDDALRTNLTTNNPRNFVDGNGEFTIVSVARYSGTDRERIISAVSGHNWLFGFHGGSTNRNGHYDGWGSLDPAPLGFVNDTNWHLHANQMNVFSDQTNPAGDWWRDGVLVTNDGRGTGDAFVNNVPDGLSLGAWNGLGESSTAEVSELLFFNRSLADGELQLLHSYLATKYTLGIPVPITTTPVVTKLGTGTVTFTGNNTYTAATGVNAGVLVAGSANALGATTGGTTVNSGGTLGFTGGITLTNEPILLNGAGATGMAGALTNISGNNTIAAGSTVAATDAASQISIGSLAGTLTINAAVNLKYARLIADGTGTVIVNGAIGSVLPTNPTLATLNNFNTGNYGVTGQPFNVFVDKVGTDSWLLIGRGRQGWEFDTDGQGSNLTVNQNLGTAAAFTPAAYSNAIVNDFLAQSGLAMSQIEVRIKRAENTTGTAYQESRWQNWATPNWTWVLSNPGTDVQSGGLAVTRQIVSGIGSPLTSAGANTMDFGGNDNTRIFTWAWGGHASQRGFSYGSTVDAVTNNDPANFLWESAGENHAIPYTEIYIRSTSAPLLQDNRVIKNGAGTLTFGGANTYNGTTTINAGMLVAANNTALGSIGAGTTVAVGAALGFQGNIAHVAEPVTVLAVNGNTQDSIVNVSGTNSFAGPITLSTQSTVQSTTVATFTGGDAGDGLDLTGTFPYAVNVGGPAVGPVQTATFTSTEGTGTPGLTVVTVPTNLITNYTSPNYGATANDNNLEVVMQSIRWNTGPVAFDLSGLTVGNMYKVQLLFSDAYAPAPNRFFNVAMEGTTLLTNFTSGSTTSNQVITRTYQAVDGVLNISLTPGSMGDTNPIISGITVEDLGPAPREDLNIRSDAGALTLTSGLTLDNSILTLKGAGNLILAGNLTQGAASQVVKTGTGTATLGGTNTYSGNTTVSQGVLAVQNGNAILNTAGAVNVALGGTFQLLTSETVSSYVGAGDIGAGTNDSTLALGNNVLTSTSGVSIANVTTTASGGIIAATTIIDTDDDNNATGTGIFLQAVSGIGTAADPLETTVTNFEARTGTVGVFVSNTGALNIGNVTTTLTGVDVTTSGAINLAATGTISIVTHDEDVLAPGNVTINATGATSDVNTGGANTLGSAVQASGAGSVVSLSAGRNVTLGTITAGDYGDVYSAGSILVTAGQDFIIQQFTFLDVNGAGTNTINAGRDIILFNDNNFSRISTLGGVIALTANRNISVGSDGVSSSVDTTQAGGAAAGANINLTATTGNITIRDGIQAGTAGNVTLSAPAGSITDTNINGNTRINSVAVTANSATGVLLETNVATASAAITGAGGVDLRELNIITLANVSVVNGPIAVTAGGAITNAPAATISASGNGNFIAPSVTLGNQAGDNVNFGTLTFTTTSGASMIAEDSGIDLAGASSSTGGVVLTSVDSAAAGQNITVPAGASISSPSSFISLNAGDDATIGGTLTAGTIVTINVDSGNADPTGGTLTITGAITAPGGAFFNGDTNPDTFTLAPLTGAAVSVNGNAPVIFPGDVLNLNLAAAVNPTLTLGGVGAGTWSYNLPLRPVTYVSIEQVNAVGAPFNLTLDANTSAFGNTGVDDLITLRQSGTDFVIERTGAATAPDNDDVGIIFQGALATILSFTYNGSSDNDIVTVSDVGGLIDFAGTVPGVPNNPNLAGQADFLFNGNGGTDSLVYNLTGANASQSYAIGSGSGAAGLEGEILGSSGGTSLLAYFQSVESTVRTGTGATPGGLTVIGDLSANAVSVQGNMTVTRVSVPGYTPLDFSGNNYNAVTINTLAGTDTVDLISLGTAQTNNPAITFDGGTQDDVLRVRTTSGNTGVVTLSGGLGNDTFNLFDNVPTVDAIVGPVIVDGGDGNVSGNNDTLVIDDRGDLTADTVIIGAVNPATSADYRIDGITTAPGNDVVFRNVDSLSYTATQGNDILDTQLTNTVLLHDLSIVTVNGWLGSDQFLLFTSDQGGGTGPTPTGVASGVAIVNLNGDAPGNPNAGDGNDIFGQTAPGIVGNGSGNVGLFVPDSVRGMRPSASTAISINGGEPTGPAFPTGDTVGDIINVDVSGLPGGSALVLPTVSGVVAATGFAPLSYTQIEDFNLIVSNQLVNVQMGDTFVRGTAGQDLIQFMQNPIPGNPNHVRVRVNTLIVDFTLTGKTVTFAGASGDYVTQANVNNPAEVYGEGGDDYISGALANDYLVGGLGDDQINASGGDNVIWGDNAPTIPTDPTPQDAAIGGADVLSALNGNDVFYGGGGNDAVSAGGGNDYVYGGQGDDTLGGFEGDDRLFGGLGNDVISGHAGNDLISGGGGDDQLEGNTGNDVLLAGTGADLIGGGDGNDLLVSGNVANEASIWTSLPNTTTFNSATYSNASDNDAALITLLAQWSGAANRSGLAAITHDAQDDDLFGGTGDDDFCWETFDQLDDFPSISPADYNSFGMGTDERFGPTS